MGRIAVVLSFTRKDDADEKSVEVKIDPQGGALLTAPQFAPSGVDAPPLEGDYSVSVDVPGDSGEAVVGYLDPNNEGTAEGGEYRTYSRDENGDVAISIHLKKDGTIVFGDDTDNLVRYSELETAIELLKTQIEDNHTLLQGVLAATAPPVTFTPIPLTAVIDNAKIEEFLAPEWEPPSE